MGVEDEGELTGAQLDELRGDLIELRARLSEQLERARGSAATVALDEPIGRLSRIDALAQQQVAKAGVEATRRRLAQVHSALQRLDEGEYGYCLRTGEPIGFRRLKVRPEATLSLAGQAELERRRR